MNPQNHSNFNFQIRTGDLPLHAYLVKHIMDQRPERVGIKIYNAAPQETAITAPYPNPDHDHDHPEKFSSALEPGRKRRAVAKGVQKTLSKTSMLVNFLPTGTLLTFEMVLPSIYRNGNCSPVTSLMIHVLLGLCALSCFFFHFTDSFRGPDGKVYL